MSPLPTPPVTELHHFHPVLAEVFRAAGGDETVAPDSAQATPPDWPRLADLLGRLRAHHHQDFITGATVVASVPGVERGLWELLQRDPSNRLVATLLAHREIEMAWRERVVVHGNPEPVDAERLVHLHQIAEQRLSALCDEDPLDPYASYLRLYTARWLSLGQSESARRLASLQEAHGFHLAGAHAHATNLCPPWSDGPWDTALAFARGALAGAPPGEGGEGVVALVLIERFTQTPLKAGLAQLRSAEVRAELDALGASVAATPLRPTFAAVQLHSLLGSLQAWAGNEAAAQWHFAKLGHLFDALVWGYAAHDLLPVSRARMQALKAAR